MPKKRKQEWAELDNLSIKDKANREGSYGIEDCRIDTSQKKVKSKNRQPCSLAASSTASVDSEEEAYIFDLATNSSGTFVAAASDKKVTLFEARETGLTVHSSHSEHIGPVTALKFGSDSNDCIESCGGDGTVLGWDSRQSKVAYRFAAKKQHLNCLDSSGSLLAAGGNGVVLFWDRRTAAADGQAQPMAEFSDTHEQEVTQVCFHPEDPGSTFLSASTDGLISVFDISRNLDEDDGFKGALNLMDSVAGMGFYDAGGGKLWCRSFTENLYLWDWAAACDEDSQGGEGPLASLTDAKAQLTVMDAKDTRLEFLIGCTYDSSRDRLSLAAGAPGGDVAIFPLKVMGDACRLKPARFSLRGGHSSVVRKLLWNFGGVSAFCVFSGGEDGKLVAWSE